MLVSAQCMCARVRATAGAAAAACHSLCRGANTGSDKDQKSILWQLLSVERRLGVPPPLRSNNARVESPALLRGGYL